MVLRVRVRPAAQSVCTSPTRAAKTAAARRALRLSVRGARAPPSYPARRSAPRRAGSAALPLVGAQLLDALVLGAAAPAEADYSNWQHFNTGVTVLDVAADGGAGGGAAAPVPLLAAPPLPKYCTMANMATFLPPGLPWTPFDSKTEHRVRLFIEHGDRPSKGFSYVEGNIDSKSVAIKGLLRWAWQTYSKRVPDAVACPYDLDA